jgi:AcrR family transcriptional regulator
MTVDAIAARAGVSKPTIYRRWPGGKEELVAAALIDRRATGRQDVDTGSLRGDLLAALGQIASGLRENAHVAAGVACRLRESPELAAIVRTHFVDDERANLAAIVRRAAARGEIAQQAVPSVVADVGPALVHVRGVLLGETLDAAFLEEVVDRVLLPILLSPTR